MTTLETFAKELDGREYGDEIKDIECEHAADANLLVVFGYSDDSVEFRGAFADGAGASSRERKTYFTRKGLLQPHDQRDCECPFCGYAAAVAAAMSVTSSRDKNGWHFATDLSHAKFRVMKDGEQFCEGLVIQLPEAAP